MPTITYPWTAQVWSRDARSWTTSRNCDRCAAWHPIVAIAAVDLDPFVAMQCPASPTGIQMQIALVRDARTAHQKAARMAAIPLLEIAWLQSGDWGLPPMVWRSAHSKAQWLTDHPMRGHGLVDSVGEC